MILQYHNIITKKKVYKRVWLSQINYDIGYKALNFWSQLPNCFSAYAADSNATFGHSYQTVFSAYAADSNAVAS